MTTFEDKLKAMMARSGRSRAQCCKILGSRGGSTTARNKRRRRAETRRQEAMQLR